MEGKVKKEYKRYLSNGELVQVAKIVLMGIGKYSFKTSLFGTKPWELNINMPMFDTEEEADKWILSTGKWQ